MPPADRRVELPPPTHVLPSSVVIRGYRSVVGFIFAELALLLGSGLTWRLGGNIRMIVDELGISVRRGRDTDVVPWSEVRHLLLVPVVTPERQDQRVPAELYHVLTAPGTEPIELGSLAVDDGTPHIFASVRE
ncbi:MAG TPA: hypothetical protein VGP82_10005 [Ktedonobacterales bacterium]|nr:hypothetical protein [Ktedonobacterales bacterium]